MVAQMMMVESLITVAQMTRLVVTGTASRGSNAPPMAIAAGLLLAYNIG